MINYVARENIRKPFACFILLKFLFAGKFHESYLEQVMKKLKIKDKRTFNKYFKILLAHRLLTYNPKSGYYFVRSFDKFREIHKIKDRTSVIFLYHHFGAIQSFIDAAIIGHLIKKQEYFWEKGKNALNDPHIIKGVMPTPLLK